MEYKHDSIYEAVFRQRSIFMDVFMVCTSIVFMAALSNIRIPLWPVPVTLQTFGVFSVAFFFGARKGIIAMLAYLAAGIAGLGVFSGGKAGIGAVLGPTGGYLVGFVFMAYFVGMMIEKGYGRSKWSVFSCMLVGEIILYAFGLAGLWMYMGNVGLLNLLMAGFVPFVAGDILKIFAAMALFPSLFRASEKPKG